MSLEHQQNPGPLLPLDVFSVIGSHLTHSDLVSLLRTNHSLHRLLAPTLYKHISIDFSRGIELVQGLLHLLSNDDDNRPYARNCHSLVLDSSIYQLLSQRRSDQLESQIATAVARMTNLRSYTDWTGATTLSSPVWRALVGKGHRLAELNVRFAPFQDPGDGPVSVCDPSPFCALASPGLRRLRLDFGTLNIPLKSSSWLVDVLNNAPNLEELFLDHYFLGENHRGFGEILSKCILPKLKILDISVGFGIGKSLTTKLFIQAHPGLVQLSVNSWYEDEPSGSVAHLQPTDFPNLRRFSTRHSCLSNYPAVLSPDRPITHLWTMLGIPIEYTLEETETGPNNGLISLLHHTRSGLSLQYFTMAVSRTPSIPALERFVDECPNLREVWFNNFENQDDIAVGWWQALGRLQLLEALHIAIHHNFEATFIKLADACPRLRFVSRGCSKRNYNGPLEVWRVVRDAGGSNKALRLVSLGYARAREEWEMPFLLDGNNWCFTAGAKKN